MKYLVIVDCPRQRRGAVKRPLRKYGLKWAGNGKFKGSVNRKNFEGIATFCQKRHLKYRINNAYGARSADYRRRFFRANPPHIMDMYFCAYCGRLKRRRYITVDHLYPVGRASRSIQLQRKLRKMGIRNINSVRNLVPACKRCNSRKGKKMGLWIIRGRIGRHPGIWVMRHTMRLITVSILLYWFLSSHEQEISALIQEFLR